MNIWKLFPVETENTSVARGKKNLHNSPCLWSYLRVFSFVLMEKTYKAVGLWFMFCVAYCQVVNELYCYLVPGNESWMIKSITLRPHECDSERVWATKRWVVHCCWTIDLTNASNNDVWSGHIFFSVKCHMFDGLRHCKKEVAEGNFI